jgi:hypothetical protein
MDRARPDPLGLIAALDFQLIVSWTNFRRTVELFSGMVRNGQLTSPPPTLLVAYIGASAFTIA